MASVLKAPAATAPRGTYAIVQIGCAFGNSLTLPLLYLLTVFSGDPVGAAAATGFTALVLLGWSPLFWTFGFIKLINAMGLGQNKRDDGGSFALQTSFAPNTPPSWPSFNKSTPDAWPRSDNQSGQVLGNTQLQDPVQEVQSPSLDDNALPADMRDLPGPHGCRRPGISSSALPGRTDHSPKLLPAESTSKQELVLSQSSSDKAEMVTGSQGILLC
jgi:hypothetical protein